MKRPNRILDFYASKSWAILEANLHEMYQIYQTAIERKALDQDFDIEAVAAKVGRPLDNTRSVTVRDGIAVIPVSGPIFRKANLFTEISGATSIEALATDFEQAKSDPAVKGIVLEINSPGGEVDGTSELAQHIAAARGTKPVFAYVSHLGASAAYWLASAADEIVANDTASLGSIGVVGSIRVSKDKNMIEFVSSQSPNKRPNPETEAGKRQIQSLMDDLAQVFIESVARNRDMTADEVIEQGGAGGLKVGQRAVDAGLADRLGTLEGVIAELAAMDPMMPNPMPKRKRKHKNVNMQDMLNIGSMDSLPEGDIKMADKDPKDIEKQAEKPAIDAKTAELKDAKAAEDPEPDGSAAELEVAKTELAEKERELASAKTENETLAKQIQSLQTTVDNMQKDARTTRFTAMAKDWSGDAAENVAMLEHLATTVGEDSELFKAHVKHHNAIAEQLRTSDLFRELGSSEPVAGSAEAELNAAAKKLAQDEKITYQQAYDKIWAANADLRNRFRAEQRVN